MEVSNGIDNGVRVVDDGQKRQDSRWTGRECGGIEAGEEIANQ